MQEKKIVFVILLCGLASCSDPEPTSQFVTANTQEQEPEEQKRVPATRPVLEDLGDPNIDLANETSQIDCPPSDSLALTSIFPHGWGDGAKYSGPAIPASESIGLEPMKNVGDGRDAIDFPVDVTGANMTTKGNKRIGKFELVCGKWLATGQVSVHQVDCTVMVNEMVADLSDWAVYSRLVRRQEYTDVTRKDGRNFWSLAAKDGTPAFELRIGILTCLGPVELEVLLTPPN